MRFSARSDFAMDNSNYGEALGEARGREDFIDLTISNPTRCGFIYPEDAVLAAFNNPAVLQYDPDPLGMRSAREAVSRLYRDAYQADVPPEHLLLTASTSDAYGYLLRLLCDPDDAILVPSPSYPLFDLLARLHDVEVTTYPLVYHDGWQIDPRSLAAAMTPRTRAIVAIHPNNPTGHYCSPADRAALSALAATHGLPLIVDEVFLEYAIEGDGFSSFAQTQVRGGQAEDAVSASLTFVLGGLSKLLALPQMKLAWTAVCGPKEQVNAAMERLEVIADTFLSVATPPQVALPAWLSVRKAMHAQIVERIRENLRVLDSMVKGTAISRLKVEGGWSAVLRVPASESDTDIALHLLGQHRVAVHPGSLYGFPERGWLVVSLLPQRRLFEEGIRRLAQIEFGTPFPHAGTAL